MNFEVINLVRNIFFLAFVSLFFWQFIPLYANVSQNRSLKKLWVLLAIVLSYDFLVWILGIIKASVLLGTSSVVLPSGLMFFSKLARALLPFIMLLFAVFAECLADANWRWRKRHYFFAILAVGLAAYFVCAAFTSLVGGQDLPDEAFVLALSRLFIIAVCLTSLLVLLRKFLIQPDLPRITRSQTKIAMVWVLGTGVVMQPLWLLKDALFGDAFLFVNILFSALSVFLVGGLYFSLYRLFNLRLFNATNYVTEFWETSFLQPFCEATQEVREATNLPELGMIVKSFFRNAFGFTHDEVKLYIRPTHHELNVEAAKAVCTLAVVEQSLCSESVTGQLAERIKAKRILIYPDIEYEKLYDLSPDAKEFFSFLERCKAEIFIPIYGRKSLIGYIIVDRYARQHTLVRDTEVSGMLAFVDQVSQVIDRMQRCDPKLLEQENLDLKFKTYQLFQEIEHTREGMRSIMNTQASEAVGMIFVKQKKFLCASKETCTMLGVPEGSFELPKIYEPHVRQLFDEFKKYRVERSLMLADTQKNPLRFTILRDPNKHGAVILVSYPSVSEALNLPVMGLRTYEDWMYAIFLRTTASGKMIENFIPANSGGFLDFKIKFLRTIFARRPLLLQGATDDVRKLAEVYKHIAARMKLESLIPEYSEQKNELGIRLFGLPGQHQGLCERLSATGVLLIEHVERLSLETQQQLAEFFATGSFHQIHGKRLLASDVLVIATSKMDVKQLVETGRFSRELYEHFSKNHLMIPALASMNKQELIDLIAAISFQLISEGKELAQFVTLTPGEIDEVISELLPSSVCDLREQIMLRLQSRLHRQGLAGSITLDAGFNEIDTVVAHARRLGKAGLKNEELVRKIMDVVKSSTKAGEIFGVDRSTVIRYCKRYRIDLGHKSPVRESVSGISI